MYVCFFVFVAVMKYVLDFFNADEEHHQLHKWAFLAIDGVIVCGLIRKIVILVLH